MHTMTTPSTPTNKELREKLAQLAQAYCVLDDYAKKDSCIDSGNVYFAACVYRDEAQSLLAERDHWRTVAKLAEGKLKTICIKATTGYRMTTDIQVARDLLMCISDLARLSDHQATETEGK